MMPRHGLSDESGDSRARRRHATDSVFGRRRSAAWWRKLRIGDVVNQCKMHIIDPPNHGGCGHDGDSIVLGWNEVVSAGWIVVIGDARRNICRVPCVVVVGRT